MRKVLIYSLSLFLILVFAGCAGKKKEGIEPQVEQPKVEEEISTTEPAEGTEIPGYEEEGVVRGVDELAREMELVNIYFDFDKYFLRPEAKEALQKNARILKANPQIKIKIEGHCDERGTVEYNLALGEKRSRSARDYLINLGIDPGRISIISYGKERPVAMGHNEDAWYKNRRDEFVIVTR